MADYQSPALEIYDIQHVVIMPHNANERTVAVLAESIQKSMTKPVTAKPAEIVSRAQAAFAGANVIGDTGIEQSATAASILSNPTGEAIRLAASSVVGAIGGASDQSEHTARYAADMTGEVLGAAGVGGGILSGIAGASVATVAAPAVAIYFGIDKTVTFLDERADMASQVRLAEIQERTGRIASEYTAKMQIDERAARASWPEWRREADRAAMLDAGKTEFDVGVSSGMLEHRVRVEEAVVESGAEPEKWFAELQEYKASRVLELENTDLADYQLEGELEQAQQAEDHQESMSDGQSPTERDDKPYRSISMK